MSNERTESELPQMGRCPACEGELIRLLGQGYHACKGCGGVFIPGCGAANGLSDHFRGAIKSLAKSVGMEIKGSRPWAGVISGAETEAMNGVRDAVKALTAVIQGCDYFKKGVGGSGHGQEPNTNRVEEAS